MNNEPTFEIEVEKLSESGVRVMLTKLLGLEDSAMNSWSVLGPLVEAHKICLDYNLANREWRATCEGEVDVWAIAGKNPRLAIGRLLIARQMLSDPNSSYAIRVSYKTAIEFGHVDEPDLDGVIPGPEDKVILSLTS